MCLTNRSLCLLAGVSLALALAACSSRDDEEAAASPPKSEPEHVWKDQVKALDKAKQVEQTMDDAYQRRADEIERQQ